MAEILVVDDDPAIRLAYRALLANAGHAVSEAGNGQDAIARLGGRRFDLVITDLWMPGVDGFTVIATAKSLQPKAAVLAFSGGMLGHGTDDPATRAKAAGADAVIEKPMLGDGMLSTVNSLLARTAAPTLVS